MTQERRRFRRARMAGAVATGIDLTSVTQRFKVCWETVRSACREYGVPLPAGTYKVVRPQGRDEKNKRSNRTLIALAQLQNTRCSVADIARQLGVTRQCIHAILCQARVAGIRFAAARKGNDHANGDGRRDGNSGRGH